MTNQFLIRLDSTGKQLGSTTIPYVGMPVGMRAHFLPKGGVIIPFQNSNRITEFDAAGKQGASITYNQPSSVAKLANGNLLVVSRNNNKVVEIDKNGKQLSSRTVSDGRVMFATRR